MKIWLFFFFAFVLSAQYSNGQKRTTKKSTSIEAYGKQSQSGFLQKINAVKLDSANVADRHLIFVHSKFEKITGLKFSMYTSSISNTISHPEYGIVLNRKQVGRLLQKAGDRKFDYYTVLALLVSHEVAHQVQFKFYAASQIFSSCNEVRRIFESQADIISGILINDFFEKAFFEEMPKNVYEIIDLIFQDEITTFSTVSSHPNYVQRSLSVKAGISYVKNLDFLGIHEDDNFTESDIRRFRKIPLISNEFYKIMEWSRLHSEMIMNSCKSVSKCIGLVSMSRRYRSYDNSLYYEVIYRNTCNVAIEFRFYAVVLKNYDTHAPLSERIVSGRPHEVTIKPNSDVKISGVVSLRDEFERNIILCVPPNDYLQFSSFNSSDCGCDSVDYKSQYSYSHENYLASNSLLLTYTVSKIVDEIAENARRHILGPFKYINNFGGRIFKSELIFPGSLHNEVLINKNDTAVVAYLMCQNSNTDGLFERYIATCEIVQSALENAGYDVICSMENREGGVVNGMFETKEKVVNLFSQFRSSLVDNISKENISRGKTEKSKSKKGNTEKAKPLADFFFARESFNLYKIPVCVNVDVYVDNKNESKILVSFMNK